jgi:hypothetical protein
MKIVLTIPDDLAERYKIQAAAQTKPTPLETVLLQHLTKFVNLTLTDSYLHLSGKDRQKVEGILGCRPLQSADDLCSRIEELAGISLGRIRLSWTPHRFRQLQDVAARNGIDPEVYAKQVLKAFEDSFFTFSPRFQPAPETVPSTKL